MLFEVPFHKKNTFSISINGNFKDSRDSFYKLTKDGIFHITFKKGEGDLIYEEVREVVVLKEVNHLFPDSFPILIYPSRFKTIRSYRTFLTKQEAFSEHEEFIKKYAYFFEPNPYWNASEEFPF